jgi:hypothetical protein
VDINTPEGMAQLRRAAPMLAPQFEQAASQRAYQTAQTARLRAQTDADRFKLYRGQLGGVNDQAAWDDWRGRVVQEFPQFAGSIPQRFSPQARLDVAGGAELLIQRATADAAAARPDEFSRTLRAAGILPGTPEYQTAMQARAEHLQGARPTPSDFVMIEGAPFARVREGNTFRLIPVLEGDEPATTGAAPAAPPANAFVAPPAAVAPAVAAPAAAPSMFPRTPAEARAQRLAQEEDLAFRRERGQLRARSAADAQSDLTTTTEALNIIGSVTASRPDMPEGRSLLQTATGSFAGAGRDLATRATGIGETYNNIAAAELETLQASLVSLLPRMRGDLNKAEFESLQAQAAKIGDRTQTYESRLAAVNALRNRLVRVQQRLARETGTELPPTPAPAPVTPPPATGAQGAAPRIRPDGRTARITGQQGPASTTATPGAEAPPVPPGVEATPEQWGLLWSVMPERERALWRRN